MTFRNTDEDWKSIAEENPYWGVLSVDEFLGKTLSSEHKNKFYESGRIFVDNLIAFIRSSFKEEVHFDKILDFGCGVGRLCLPFAQHCNRVVGIDVAPRMLQICNEEATANGIANLSLFDSLQEVIDKGLQFSLVNSYIVIQHIPPPRGVEEISKLLSVIEPGGYCSLQFTYAKESKFISNDLCHSKYYRKEGSTITDLTLFKDNSTPQVTMFDYDLNMIFSMIQEFAGTPIQCLPTNDDGHLGLHLLFRKAS
jgi:SAM-dependent methyltransferase